MKRNRIVILMGIIAAVCVVVSIFLYITSRNSAPVIDVPTDEITYEEGGDTSILLNGVTAEDKEDGDLSSKIFIDEIVVLSDTNAQVIYGVVDSNGASTSATRDITYETLEAQKARKAAEEAAAAAKEEASSTESSTDYWYDYDY